MMKSKTQHTSKMGMKRKIETITSKPTTITSATGKKPPLKSELISQLKLLENEYDDLVKANKNNLETIKMVQIRK